VYDSVVVLTKQRHAAPFSELSGDSEFINHPRTMGAIHLEMLATRDAAITRAADLEREATDLRAQAGEEAERSREELRLLRSELAGVRTDLERLREENAQTSSDLLGSWEIIREMRRSKSWKLTAPLRGLKSLLARR
jgi:hypothetical protein